MGGENVKLPDNQSEYDAAVSTFASADAPILWRQRAAHRAQFLGPATELMLDLANLREGSRVLDVAAGTGEQSLLAARRVGATGHLLAIDLAAHMLEEAAASARAAGIEIVETRVMNAQDLKLEPASFDAAISRLGVMLVPHPSAVFKGVWRVLKPGGKFAVLVNGMMEHNVWGMIPLSIIRRVGRLHAAERSEPRLFALGAPGLLTDCFTAAGFRHVAEHTVDATRRFASRAEAFHYLTVTQNATRNLLAQLSDADRACALREIELALDEFVSQDGVALAGEAVVGVGTK
jgi:ubiquinone/menaquinone biosynthesis C-methylase UbiE